MEIIQYQNGKTVPDVEMTKQTVEKTLDYPNVGSFEMELPSSDIAQPGVEFFKQDNFYPDRYWRYLKDKEGWVRVNCNPNPIK